MVPFKIQYLQAGALSSDRLYQSLHKLPEIHHQVLENSIQKYLERLQEQTPNMEKSEQTKLRDREKREASTHSGGKHSGKSSHESSVEKNLVEKDEQGHIKHIDVKI